ncbi:hypothetical protein [Nocardiopsis synnemataformans]|uniref:hypothetical protein n=1 Tax=Nocardiopsis synnemataformans TaxID=61305 RepID=UPI003EBA182A
MASAKPPSWSILARRVRALVWVGAWGVALLGAAGAAATNEQMMGSWYVAVLAPTLGLCVVGLEASSAAGWAPGPFRPGLAWCMVALNTLTSGVSAWLSTGEASAFSVGAVFGLALAPVLAHSHTVWRLRTAPV